jgi:hypothetical protein
LTFDRAVDIAGIDGAAITVNDPLTLSSLFDGSGGATLVLPTVVQLTLVPAGLPSGVVVTLSATDANGIAPAGGGAAWAGVTNLELPFP